jgi:hypothetical protein
MLDDKQTKIEFAAVLNAVMVGMYGRPELQRETLAMWFMALQRFDLADIRGALSRHVGDADRGQFPPRPADVVRQIEGSTTGAAPLAWGKVIKAVAQVGSWTTVVFDDAAIHAAIADLGGWPEICRCTNDELPFLQRRFESAYRSYRERGKFDYPPRLLGSHAITNGGNGFGTGGALLIGDPQACQLVQERGAGHGLQLTQDTKTPKDSGTLKAIGGALLSLVPSGKRDAA